MIDLKIEDLKEKLKIEKVKEFLSDEVNRMYLILGGTAVFAVLYLSLLIFPQIGGLFKSGREVSDLRGKINLVSSRVKRLDEMKKKLNSLRTEQAGYSKQLPAQKEIPRFLEDLASMAEGSNVAILSVTPLELIDQKGKKKGKQYYRAMPIRITAKGGYHQLGHFAGELEQGRRFIKIEDLGIRYDPKLPRRHNIRMVLKTYVSVEDEKK